MTANQKPPSHRRRYRRREIDIEEPKLLKISESERQATDSARRGSSPP